MTMLLIKSSYLETSMKYVGIIVATALAALLVACGSDTSSTVTNPANGAWSATVANSSGQQLGSFTFNMAQNSTALTGSNMNFSNMGTLAQCFGNGTTFTGQMGPGRMNGGTMSMTMSWTPSGGTQPNTLTMQGTMAMGMGSGSGTFTLTGQTPGCTSQMGTFTMTHMST
jgi:hypothetical protein